MENSFNNVTMEAQGPSDHNYKNESQKAWTMEMLMKNGDISMGMANEPEQLSEEDKKFLYARAVCSNHSVQYHMHQIIKRQKVVDKYRSMTMEGMGLTPLDSNLHQYDLVIISQIMPMIDADNFWHQKTFNVVLTALWRRWDEQIHEQKDVSMHCTENSEINNKMDEWKLLTCSVRARLKMVNDITEKKTQSKKVKTK